MKINAVISPQKLRLPSVNVKNSSALISFFVIAAGLIFGSLFYIFENSLLNNDLWDYFVRFSLDFSNKNKPEILSGLIISNLPYVGLTVVFGTCAVGTPAVLLLAFFKSAGLGALACFIYNTYALKGIEYCLLVFFPGKIILLFAMLLLTQSSFTLSKDIFQSVRQNFAAQANIERYFVRSFFICALFIVSSLVDFLTVTSFASLFSFS